MYVEFDAATNAVLLSGSPAELQKAMEVIKLLDVAPTITGRATQLIRVRHSDAKDLAKLMEQVIQQQAVGRARREIPGVTTDPRTNTLLVTCEQGDYEPIRKIIEALDVPVEAAVARAEPLPTRARVTMYQVSVHKDKTAGLQASSLAAAKDDAALSDLLGRLGDTRLLYAIDQAVELEKNPSMKISSQRPIPGATGEDKDGRRRTTVNYYDVGCIVNMRGQWPAQSFEPGSAIIEVEITNVALSNVDAGLETKAPILSKLRQNFAGPVESGRAVVLVSLDAGGGPDTTTAYVTRIELSRGEQQAPRA
jgi:hypothetical protein